MNISIPGTALSADESVLDNPLMLIEKLITGAGGLTLSQVSEVTGVRGSTIQNWVKRGWVENPAGKRYSEQQIVRIILINMLRGTMQLEQAADLMTYINGRVDDRSDDIIPDKKLFTFLCRIIAHFPSGSYGNTEEIQRMIVDELSDFTEPFYGAKQKLEATLTVMVLACQASELKNNALAAYNNLYK